MPAVRLADSLRYGFKLFTYLVVLTAVGGGALVLGGTIAWPEVEALRGPGQASKSTLAGGAILVALGTSILLTGYVGTVYKLIADAVAKGGAASDQPVTATATDEDSEASTADERAGTEAESDAGTEDDAPTEPAPSTGDSGEEAPPAPAGSGPTGGDSSAFTDERSSTAPEPPQSASPSGPSASESGSASGSSAPDAGAEPPEQRAKPREPTAEEIAFGTEPTVVDDDRATGSGSAQPSEQTDDENDEEDVEVEETTTSVKPAGRDAPSDPLGER